MRCAVGSSSIQSSIVWRRGPADVDCARIGSAEPTSAPIAAEPMPSLARKWRRAVICVVTPGMVTNATLLRLPRHRIEAVARDHDVALQAAHRVGHEIPAAQGSL